MSRKSDLREPEIPAGLRRELAGYTFVRETIGRSGDGVFRLSKGRCAALVVKVSPVTAAQGRPSEADRLTWLKSVEVPVPRVLHEFRTDSETWLVMECLPGANAAVSTMSPTARIALVARALRDLHELPADACPFDETLDVRIGRAQVRVRQGAVDERDFDSDNLGRSAMDLLADAIRLRPGAEDLVVTHGDATLPNMILDGRRISGFVDCGRAGRADRYQDLALACRSMAVNLGQGAGRAFLGAYGLTSVDDRKLQYYRLMDEFS